GHFFMKKAARGTTIIVDGEALVVGRHSSNPDHQASARALGIADATTSVTIGNSIVEAVGLLKDALIVNDPRENRTEIYTADGSELWGYASASNHDCRIVTAAIDTDPVGSLTPTKLAAAI